MPQFQIINGIRNASGIQDTPGGKKFFENPQANWAQTDYNELLGPMRAESPSAFVDCFPILFNSITWKSCYVNQNILPTQANAENPAWSNYIWNRSGSPGGGAVYDGLTAALNSSLIQNGNGVAKVSLGMGLTASGGPLNVPQFILDRDAWHWIDRANVNGAQAEYARFDVPAVVDQAKWFLTGFLKKFGNNRGIHHIQLNEYYFGSAEWRPDNFSRAGAQQGYAQLWPHVNSVAPRDGDGARINLLQMMPQFESGVTISTLTSQNMGAAISDLYLRFPLSAVKELADVKAVSNAGQTVVLNGDSRYSRQGRKQSWANTPANPFGHNGSYSGVVTPQEAAWFYGAKGPLPINVFGLGRTYGATPGPQTLANYRDAIRKFGAGGTLAGQWGPVPKILSAPSNPVNHPPQGDITLSGTPAEVGTTFRAITSNLTDQNGLGFLNYQWRRDNLPINGAGNNDQYQAVVADVGALITCRVYYNDNDGFFNEKVSIARGPIASNTVTNNPPTGDVSISGVMLEGELITFGNSLQDLDGKGPVTYRLFRGTTPIFTGTEYTLTSAEVGETIYVVCSYTDGLGRFESKASPLYGPVEAQDDENQAPTGPLFILGIPRKGQTLTAIPQFYDADGKGSLSYQWKRNGKIIINAKFSTYKLIQDDVGTQITCVASYRDGDNQVESVESAPTPIIEDFILKALRLSKTIMPEVDDWQPVAANNNQAAPNGWPEDTQKIREINDSGRENMAVIARFKKDIDGSLTAAGGSNSYAITLNRSSIDQYGRGLYFACRLPVGNTGAATMNVNGIGSRSIVNPDGSFLAGGELASGGIYVFRDDGTRLQFVSGGGGDSVVVEGGGVSQVNAGDNTVIVSGTQANRLFRADVGEIGSRLVSDGTIPAAVAQKRRVFSLEDNFSLYNQGAMQDVITGITLDQASNYLVELWLAVTCTSAAPNFRFRLNSSTGFTLTTWSGTINRGVTNNIDHLKGTVLTQNTAIVANNADTVIQMKGFIVSNQNAAQNLVLQAQQDVATTVTTNIRRGSFLVVEET